MMFVGGRVEIIEEDNFCSQYINIGREVFVLEALNDCVYWLQLHVNVHAGVLGVDCGDEDL